MNFDSHANKIHFEKKGLELSLVLKMFNGACGDLKVCLPSAENLLGAPTVIIIVLVCRLATTTCNSAEKRQRVQGKVVRFNPSTDEL